MIELLGKQYLLAVAASGGAVGAAAAAPAVGTGVGPRADHLRDRDLLRGLVRVRARGGERARDRGEEDSRRRTLLLATVLGEQGAQMVGSQTGLDAAAWARSLLVNMPTAPSSRSTARSPAGSGAQATRQGALALGRVAPFGIGALIGVTGARAIGRTVTGAQRAFGPPPERFPEVLGLSARRRLRDRPGWTLPGLSGPAGTRATSGRARARGCASRRPRARRPGSRRPAAPAPPRRRSRAPGRVGSRPGSPWSRRAGR